MRRILWGPEELILNCYKLFGYEVITTSTPILLVHSDYIPIYNIFKGIDQEITEQSFWVRALMNWGEPHGENGDTLKQIVAKYYL